MSLRTQIDRLQQIMEQALIVLDSCDDRIRRLQNRCPFCVARKDIVFHHDNMEVKQGCLEEKKEVVSFGRDDKSFSIYVCRYCLSERRIFDDLD